jgi:hypothetical protein
MARRCLAAHHCILLEPIRSACGLSSSGEFHLEALPEPYVILLDSSILVTSHKPKYQLPPPARGLSTRNEPCSWSCGIDQNHTRRASGCELPIETALVGPLAPKIAVGTVEEVAVRCWQDAKTQPEKTKGELCGSPLRNHQLTTRNAVRNQAAARTARTAARRGCHQWHYYPGRPLRR